MRNLLTKQEHRWFHFLEILTLKNDWVILSDLSAALDCSNRILKMDIKILNESFNDFNLVTSNKGVKVEYNDTYSFKTFCQKLLTISDTYRLLEVVFLNDGMPAKDVADKLNISLSTLYRMVEQLNDRIESQFNFTVETGPCRITGDEEAIRFFFCVYFNEKYRHIEWPFENVDQDTISSLTAEFIRSKDFPYDFIYFNVIRIVSMVNYTRYKDNYKVNIPVHQETVEHLMLDKPEDAYLRRQMEEMIQGEYNEEFITQVLSPFVKPDVYHSIHSFREATKEDEEVKHSMKKLREILAVIAANSNIPLLNIEKITYALYNTVSLEYSQPQSRHILYNRNGFFAREVQRQFPEFYDELYAGMVEFREYIGRPVSDRSINYYIFIVFSWWENLMTELLQKLYKINVLVISDRYQSHAKMMADYLRFEYGERLDIHTTDLFFMKSEVFDLTNYDLIITSFMDNELQKRRSIYVGNMLKPDIFENVQKHIDEIIADRMKS